MSRSKSKSSEEIDVEVTYDPKFSPGQTFDKSDMRGRNFSGQNLRGCSFKNCDLRGADFVKSNLQGVEFCGSNLRGANFTESNLRGSDFDGAILDGCNFQDAILLGVEFSKNNNIDDWIGNWNIKNWGQFKFYKKTKCNQNVIICIGQNNPFIIEGKIENNKFIGWYYSHPTYNTNNNSIVEFEMNEDKKTFKGKYKDSEKREFETGSDGTKQ